MKASALTSPRGRCIWTGALGVVERLLAQHLATSPYGRRRSRRSTHEEETMRTERLVSLVVGTALILGASVASAQQPAAAPPPPPPYGTPITLEQAKKVMAGAEAEAKKNNWNVVMVVLDSGGNLVMLQRMDGAQFGSIEVAKEKAYSAVAFRRPTKAFDDALAQGGNNLRILRVPGASPLEGGIPIVVDGKLIGSVGVSGVTSAQDAQIGRAGIDSLLTVLEINAGTLTQSRRERSQRDLREPRALGDGARSDLAPGSRGGCAR